MAKAYYIPSDDQGKASWLNKFAAQLPSHAATLGLTTAETAALTADAAYFAYAMKSVAQAAAYSQQWTAYKNAARDGKAASLGLLPVAIAVTPVPAVVAPGILLRATALAGRIKKQPGYNESIGQSLGLIGAEQTVDLITLKPVLRVVQQAGGVVLVWTKQGMDGLEIHVDRGGGFAFLAVDTVPDYTDTQPIPAGQSALWKYKAIYRQGDDRVGQWSDVVSLAVAG